MLSTGELAGARVELLDTTLRDGTQGEGFTLTVEDKVAIARRLAGFGIPLIEGGWPGSNPKDRRFFQMMRGVDLGSSRLAAFGSTRRKGVPAEEDPSLADLLDAGTSVAVLFGKSWTLHVTEALGTTLEENLRMIADSVAFLRRAGRRVVYDAEHFFDGYKEGPDYALATLEAAAQAGADTLVLCDTNGGSLPEEVAEITARVVERFPGKRIGIHPHDDAGLALANALAAIRAGARHAQGTVGGYGERTGNLNLLTLIPTLHFKYGVRTVPKESLAGLTALARFVEERANLPHNPRAPYVGASAFAHKGGVHVSAVRKNPRTYEHVPPEAVGNRRRVLVSDLSGRSNLIARLAEAGVALAEDEAAALLNEVKSLEYAGYAYEDADASFWLLAHRLKGGAMPFDVLGFSVFVHDREGDGTWSEATVRVRVGEEVRHTAAHSPHGPVSALDRAFRQAVLGFYPRLSSVELADYKVRVLAGSERGTESGVRVTVWMRHPGLGTFAAVGASENILAASLKALVDGYAYAWASVSRGGA